MEEIRPLRREPPPSLRRFPPVGWLLEEPSNRGQVLTFRKERKKDSSVLFWEETESHLAA